MNKLEALLSTLDKNRVNGVYKVVEKIVEVVTENPGIGLKELCEVMRYDNTRLCKLIKLLRDNDIIYPREAAITKYNSGYRVMLHNISSKDKVE